MKTTLVGGQAFDSILGPVEIRLTCPLFALFLMFNV